MVTHWSFVCWPNDVRCTASIGTLRVVTARELVILSGSFTSHSKSVRWLCHLHGHMSHKRYTVSSVEGQKVNLHKFCPSGNWTPDRQLGRQMLLSARLLAPLIPRTGSASTPITYRHRTNFRAKVPHPEDKKGVAAHQPLRIISERALGNSL